MEILNKLITNIDSISSIDLNQSIREKIGDIGCLALAKSLRTNNTIIRINLGWNNIGDDGCLILAEALRINNTIIDINLENNRIGDDGCAALAELFRINNTITTITLKGNNSIGSKGCFALAESLIQNTTLDPQYLPDFNAKECLLLLGLGEEFKTKSNRDIIDFLQERYRTGSKIVYRSKLLLVGSGNAGKTTLVKKLKLNTFDGVRVQTDGIIMTELLINDIELQVYDFAGQKEYMHTHKIFFNDNCVILIIYRPDSSEEEKRDFDIFLTMVYDCAPNAQLILVTTFADGDPTKGQRPLNDNEMKLLCSRNPNSNIMKIVTVDSSTGRGIDNLKESIREVALQLPKIKSDIPNSFYDLQILINSLSNTRFSISAEEFLAWATEKLKKLSLALLAYDLFCDWGITHKLSNEDIVLQPQQLADVLACIFTVAEMKLENLKEGLLLHDNKILEQIWGKFDKRLWCFESSDVNNHEIDYDPPFIQLLHESGLAYKLRDDQGKWLPISLIPALLPRVPYDFDSDKAVNDDSLKELFFNGIEKIHNTIKLTFKPFIPVTFFPQLQVELKYIASHNGSWLNGSYVQIVGQTKSDTSYAVVYQDISASTITIISAGENARARNGCLNLLTRLKMNKYRGIDWDTLSFNGIVWDKNKIEDTITNNEYLKLPKEPKLSHKDQAAALLSSTTVVQQQHLSAKILKHLSPYAELSKLYELIKMYEENDDSSDEIYIQHQLNRSISDLFLIMGVQPTENIRYSLLNTYYILNNVNNNNNTSTRRRKVKTSHCSTTVKTLWLPAYDESNQLVLVPLSPFENPQFSTSWKIVVVGKVPIEVCDSTVNEDIELYNTTTDIIFAVLDILDVHINKNWRWASIKRIIECPFDQIHDIYLDLFREFDMYYVYKNH